jgi:methyltransferase
MSAVPIVVGAIALSRLAELAYAAKNARALRMRGAVEFGAAHYPLFVLLHAFWLLSVLVWVPWSAAVNPFWLALLVVLQFLRLWIIASLGPYWTTRVLTLPGAPLVRRGPYRLVAHPNYLCVAAEIAVLPLVFGAWQIALVFALLNAALLAWRIRVEGRALAPRRALG